MGLSLVQAFILRMSSLSLTLLPRKSVLRRKMIDQSLGSEVTFDHGYKRVAKLCDDSRKSMINDIKVQVIGCPFGTGSVTLAAQAEDEITRKKAKIGNTQQLLPEHHSFGSRDSAVTQERKRLIEQEKLLQRCTYVNSLEDALGICSTH